MKIIAFIEAHQGDTIRKILEHCGLWHDPPPRAPPPESPTRSIPTSSNTRIARKSTSPNCPGSHEPEPNIFNFGLAKAGIAGYHARMLPADGPRAVAAAT
jgi:hypothetical protein